MKVDEQYPLAAVFLRNELETLRYIKDSSMFEKHYNQLSRDATVKYFKLHSSMKKLQSFNFVSEIDICLDRKSSRTGKAVIGADVEINSEHYEKVSYFLAICEDKNPQSRLVRKYHFDYDLYDPKGRQPHPVFHLQYAGKLSAYLDTLNLDHAHIDSWLSEPRLFYMPMSLALLLNLVLKEFNTEVTQKIIESSEWRQVIRKNEELLLAPYFKSCHNYMAGFGNSNNLLTTDYLYGKQ